MMRRLLQSLSVLCIISPALCPVAAQVLAGTPSTFRVLKSVGTPDEQAFLQRMTDQMRRKSADATFMKSLDAAAARHDNAAARQLLADAAGVKATEVAIALAAKVGLSRDARTPFRLAADAAPFNPFMLIFRIGNYAGCIGRHDECDATMKQLGYEPA